MKTNVPMENLKHASLHKNLKNKHKRFYFDILHSDWVVKQIKVNKIVSN